MAKAKRKYMPARGEQTPVYRKTGTCPSCQQPFAVLANPEDVAGIGQSTPGILASCTCLYVGFNPRGVEEAEDDDTDDTDTTEGPVPPPSQGDSLR